MPRYFFHFHDGVDQILDPEGRLMPQEAIAGAALLQARHCIDGDVMTGRLDLYSGIDVHDEADAIVYSIKFEDALEIAPPR